MPSEIAFLVSAYIGTLSSSCTVDCSSAHILVSRRICSCSDGKDKRIYAAVGGDMRLSSTMYDVYIRENVEASKKWWQQTIRSAWLYRMGGMITARENINSNKTFEVKSSVKSGGCSLKNKRRLHFHTQARESYMRSYIIKAIFWRG